MHNNSAWIRQWPSRKDHFWRKECEGSHPQREGGLSGSPLREGREKGRKGKIVHEAPYYRSCARAGAGEDESPSGFGLGGKGGASTSQTPSSFCFITASLLSDSAVNIRSLFREGRWQCHVHGQGRAGKHSTCYGDLWVVPFYSCSLGC